MSSEAKKDVGFTPGPWEVGSGGADGNPNFIYCDDILGSAVASVPGTYTVISLEQRAANARLIAAAPELLEACQQALYDVVEIKSIGGIEAPSEAKLRAAIAKATTP